MLLQLLLAAIQCVPPGPSEAIGLWELAPGSSGFGRAIELRSDGTFLETMTVMVDGTYRVSAEGLFMDADSTVEGENSHAMPFKVTKGRFSYGDRQRREVKMVRVGSPPDRTNLVLGVWRYRHYTGGTAFEKFLPNGQTLFRLPFPGLKAGCFTVSNGAVSLSYPQGPVVLQMGTDVLRQGGEEKDILRRAAGGAWYPLTANDGR